MTLPFVASYNTKKNKKKLYLLYHTEYQIIKQMHKISYFSQLRYFFIIQTILVREKHTKFSN